MYLSAAWIDNGIVTFAYTLVGFYVGLHLGNPVPIRFAQPYRRIVEQKFPVGAEDPINRSWSCTMDLGVKLSPPLRARPS